MRRAFSVVTVHGTTDMGLVDATFDERLHEDDVPDPRRRQVVDASPSPYRAALDAWRALGNTVPPYSPPAPTPEQARAATFRADAGRIDLLDRLKTATPAQIDTWIDNNMTTIAQARTIIKAVLKVIALDGRA